ncbi:hypothetical protein AB0C91_10450 [Streptomyces sp. NPDC048674]|uniref:hypothetical protein n=1 Tax=Streptomyces sp. NPDC048674 TaxID=3155491 RepID=UPI003438C837
MNELDMDEGLIAVVGLVREVHASISLAIGSGAVITTADYAALDGAVEGLLRAIDARLPQPVEQPATALKAVA